MTSMPLLPEADIVRRVRAIRHSPARERAVRFLPTMQGLAAQAGISRRLLYMIADRGKVGPLTRIRLSAVFNGENAAHKSGTLRFCPVCGRAG